MSAERRQPFIHPFNFYIVNVIEKFHKAMVVNDYLGAAETLWHFIGWLEPDIQRKLQPEALKLDRIIQNPKSASRRELHEIQSRMATLLHEAGYFTQAKPRMITIKSFDKIEEPKDEE